MAAARQLKWFGYEVVVLEARGRVGGRVHSEVCGEEGREVDTGAMIITGIHANLNPKPLTNALNPEFETPNPKHYTLN